MKIKAQSLIEFAVILMSVTVVAIVSLQIVSNKINSTDYKEEEAVFQEKVQDTSLEESNCTKMGLFWDKQNGVCEAR